MKKILGILGGIVILSSSASSLVSCNSPLSQTGDQDEFIPEETFEMNEILQNILNGSKVIENDNELINIVTQSELMLRDTYSENMFYKLNNNIEQVLQKFKDKLTNIKYETNGSEMSDSWTIFNNYLKKLDLYFSDKLNSGDLYLWGQYEKYKSEEAHLFFDKYDEKNTVLMNQILITQNKINNLNVENESLKEQIKGLNKQNEIIVKILKVLDQTTKFIGKVKEIFENADYKVESNYSRAKWHNDHFGLGFIPFIGIGFNVDFKDAMEKTCDGIQLYLDTFLDGKGEGKKAQDEMIKSLNGLEGELSNIDPLDNDIVKKIIGETKLDPKIGNILANAADSLISKVQEAMGPFGPAFGAVMEWLGTAFNAYKLHEQFRDFSNKYNKDFVGYIKENGNEIDNSFESINKTKNDFSKIFKSNNDKSRELINKINFNESEIKKMNLNLDKLKDTKKYIDNNLVGSIDQGMYSDYYYYWNANKIGDIKYKVLYNEKNDDIDFINKEKNIFYNKLINKNYISEIKDELKYENDVTNEMYKESKLFN